MDDHTINILLIDHAPAGVQAIRAALLAAEGDATIRYRLNLEWAGRLAAGRDRLDRGSVDVVLLALALPDAHGLEGFTALHTHAPDVPIIVLTRPEDALLGARAVQAGAMDHLIQGRVEGSTLVRAIRYAIERYHIRDELRQLRRDLHVSSMRFQNIIARSVEGIIIVDRNGFLRFANPAAQALFGRDEHDLLGTLFGFPVVAGETTEIEIIRGDGVIVVAEMRVVETVWEGVITHLASLRDITERRRMRQERDGLLQEVDAQRRLLQTLVDNTPAGIAVLDGTELTVKSVNQAYQQFLEEPYRHADITGLRLQDFVPRAEESGLVELFRTVAASGQPHTDSEYEHVGFARGVTYWRWSLLPTGAGRQGPPDLMIIAVEITEQVLARKRVEELAAQEEQSAAEAQRRADELDAVFAALTEPVVIYDADGSLVKANPAAISSFGFDPVGEDRATLMQKVAINHRDGRNMTADELISIRALRRETVVNETFLFTNADGRQSIILASAAPIWTNGRPSGVVALWHDITERERAEGARAWLLAREQAAHAEAAAALRARDESLAALRESEERFRLLVAGVKDYAIFMLDAEGHVVSWNEGAQQIKGWSAEEILGQHFSRFYLEEAVAAGHPQHALEIAAAEGRFEEEGWRVRKDGSRFFADVTITAIHDDSGNLRGFAKIMRDITERKAVEQALRESEERFRGLAEAMPQMVWAADTDGNSIYLNRRWIEYTGRTEGTAEERRQFIHPEDQQRVLESWREAIRTGSDFQCEYRLRRHDGEHRWFLGRSILKGAAAGEAAGWIGTATDIHDLKQAEADRERLHREVEQQRALLQTVFDSTPVGLALLEGPQHRYVLANPAQLAIARGKGQLVGRTVAEVWSEAVGHEAQLLLDQVYRTGEPFHVTDIQLFLDRGEGLQEAFFNIDYLPLQDDRGQVTGMLLVSTETTEQVRGRRKIEESEERLRLAQQAGRSGTFDWDPKTNVNLWSDDLLALYGFQPGEFGDRYESWVDCLVPEDRQAGVAAVKRSLETGELAVEFRIRRRDTGEIRWMDGRGRVFFDPAGRPARMIGIHVDITERKQAEAEIQKLAKFPAENPNPILRIAKDGVVLYANQASANLLECWNCSVGRRLPDIWHKLILDTLDSGLPSEAETACGEHVFSLAFVPIVDGGYVNIYGRDITERKRVEVALRQSEERFATAFRASPAALVITRLRDGCIIDVNASYMRLLKYRREELIGRSVTELNIYVNPDERVEFVRMLREQGSIRDYETSVRARSGEIRVVLCSFEMIKLDDEECVLSIVYDITGRKQAEEEIRKLNSELEQRVAERTARLEAANHELEAFSYSVSHDLRAPLRSIDGFSQALLEDYADKLDDTGKDYLRRVRGACQRMGQLIDDMLGLSRLTRSDMCRKQVDLSALARQIAAALQNAQPERQVEFVIAPGLIAECDPRLLRIALENLLDNAWKFTSKHPHARIEFGAMQRDGANVYFVRDDGAGFDMAFADKLFGVFQRLHKTTDFDGTGIGLVTVKRIVERHGGRVWAEGAVEQGATFYFTL